MTGTRRAIQIALYTALVAIAALATVKVARDPIAYETAQQNVPKTQTDPASQIAEGHFTVGSFGCEHGESISLDASSYGTPNFLVIGPSYGYALFYHFRDGGRYGFWIDGYTEDPKTESSLAPYDGWDAIYHRDGIHADVDRPLGRSPTNVFTPMPHNITGLYSHVFEEPVSKKYLYGRDHPPFMDIFIDPGTISFANFTLIRDCLIQRRVQINSALSTLANSLPKYLSQYYVALRLGGIVYGEPPFADPAYRAQIESFWYGDSFHPLDLPGDGSIRLFAGQAAMSKFEGKAYEIIVKPDGFLDWRVDGSPVTPYQFSSDPFGAANRAFSTTNIPYVASDGAYTWYYGPQKCFSTYGSHCPRTVTVVSQSADGSYGYLLGG